MGAFAVGAFCGLGFASFASPNRADIESERDAALGELTGVKAELAESQQEMKIAADWGPLQSIAERYGPGTPMMKFLERLEATSAWRPETNWHPCSLTYATHPAHTLHVAMGAGGNGKVVIEATLEGDQPDNITIMFWSDPMELDAYYANFSEAIGGIATAMEMPSNARRRLLAFAANIPMLNLSPSGISRCLATLPERVQREFTSTLKRYTADKYGAGYFFMGPSVVVPLGGQWVAWLAFTPLGEAVMNDVGKRHELGGWWSLCIYHELDGGHHSNDWPKLTIDEVDAMVATSRETVTQ